MITIGGMTLTSGLLEGPQAGPRNFPGVIDEVRMYNRKLSPAEIAMLATQPVFANRAPTVNVGETVRGHVGGGGMLPGMVSDDGSPAGIGTTCRWRIVSGDPSGICLADETVADTAVAFLKLGVYGVQLEATDGERVTYSDVVTVEVIAGGTVLMVK
jgi:hypothetical protein